ncbi:hypothetical protein K7J31_002863 [Vibrio parahaemolyticus]|nr:hypothetical protein [Vibrio parahaemolyticus]
MSVKNEFLNIVEDAMDEFSFGKFVAVRINYEYLICGFVYHSEEIEEIIKPSGLLFFNELPICDDLALYLYHRVFYPFTFKEKEKEFFKLCDVVKTQDGVLHLPSSIKQEVEELANIIEPLSPEQFSDFMFENHPSICEKVIEYHDKSFDNYSALNFITKVNLMNRNAIMPFRAKSSVLKALLEKHYQFKTELDLEAFKNDRGYFIGDGRDFIPVFKNEKVYRDLEQQEEELLCMQKI